MVQTASFSLLIQKWYTENSRDLPWRRTKSPYFIWLSEVILQQTRVDQGMSYYHKFCQLFPTIRDLAQASEQEVLNAWQGLGYYSRARNLRKTAIHIVDHHKGAFPQTYDELLTLPGIGPYTAAAVGSFAFDLPNAVVDGNVYRLLSRYFDIDTPVDSVQGKKEFAQLAQLLLDPLNPAQHNQAIMELGALICRPKNANCESCPLNNSCLGIKNETIYQRPIKSKKNSIRQRHFHFVLHEKNGRLLVQKRLGKDIWENMYQLPLIELEKDNETPHDKYGESIILANEPIVSYTHQLSHQKITASFWKAESVKVLSGFENTLWVNKEELNDLPLPRLIDRFFEEFG